MAPNANSARATSGMPVIAMTFDELKDCAERVTAIDASRVAAETEDRRIERERIRIKRLGDSIDVVRPKVDTKSKAAVDAYNLEIRLFEGLPPLPIWCETIPLA
jgi:hypothetical protein